MLTEKHHEELLRDYARRLGRTVIIEPFGVYLESRSGADDERIGRTIEEAKLVMERRWLRHRTAQADRSALPN